MSRHIQGDGPLTAKLLLVGESGGRDEDRTGTPFIGASGHKLNSIWHPLGLQRNHFRIENVYPFHPDNNDLTTIPLDVIESWANDLHHRVAAEMPNLQLIIPCGGLALRWAMRTGLLNEKVSIQKYRGSIMGYTDNNGRVIKSIPTIHPASIYHQRAKKARGQEKSNPGRISKHIELDWARIAHEATFPEIAAPQQTHFIIERPEHLDWMEQQLESLPPFDPTDPFATVITIDIEYATGEFDCFGCGWNASESYTIAFKDPRTPFRRELESRRRELIRRIALSPYPKNLQNGQSDLQRMMRFEGFGLENYVLDTMWLHHALDPVDDHDLAYMKSIFLRGEYHKDEAKGENAKKYATHYDAYMNYNGMDVCDQHALMEVLVGKLVERGMWEYYLSAYADVAPYWMGMTLGGIPVDRAIRKRRAAKLQCEILDCQDKLEQLAGTPLYAKKDLSPKKLKTFLYETLQLPVQRKKPAKNKPGAGAITADEVTLRKLQIKFPQKCGDAITTILEHRRKLKLMQFLGDAQVESDGRIHSEYTPLGEASRLLSKKTTFDTGANLQNIDRDVRDTFVPDSPEHIFVEMDLSQAESRIVYVLSGDDELYALAQLLPNKFDTHSFNAAMIFGTHPEPTKYEAFDLQFKSLGYVTFEQRYFGKRVEHGAQRGLHGEKMSNELLKDDVIRTPTECDSMIDRYFQVKPGVLYYFDWIKKQIIRTKELRGSWGGVWNVKYEKMDDDLYRRAFSWIPQYEVAQLLSQWGLKVAGSYFDHNPFAGRVCLTVYDSVLSSMRPEYGYELMHKLHQSVTQTRTYQTRVGPRTLSMPAEYKIGLTWKGDCEWKYLPTRSEYDDAVRKMLDKRNGLSKAA